MGRRVRACLTCPGGTRHGNRICAACRRSRRRLRPGPARYVLVTSLANLSAPTIAELTAALDVSDCITDISFTTSKETR